jgi:hypothetical protein
MDLTDEQWLLIAPLLTPPSPARRGRPTLDTRLVLNGIFWKLATHSPWYDMPPHYPSHQSCYRFYHQWRSSGLFRKILSFLLLDLRERGGLDLPGLVSGGSVGVDYSEMKRYFIASLRSYGAWQLSTAILLLKLAYDIAR